MWFITATYAGPHKTTFLNGFKARLPDYNALRALVEDLNIYHCCLDGTVAAGEILPIPLFRRTNEGTTAAIQLLNLSHGQSYRSRGRTRPPAAATPDLVFLSILRVGGARQLANKDVR